MTTFNHAVPLHTPVYIGLLLEAYMFESILTETDSRKKYYKQLLSDGLIVENSVSSKRGKEINVVLTDRGVAFAKMLLNTPLPIIQTRYVDPRFENGNNAVQES